MKVDDLYKVALMLLDRALEGNTQVNQNFVAHFPFFHHLLIRELCTASWWCMT